MPTIYLSLGSNLGNRRSYIKQAKADIGRWPKSTLLASSSLYETRPQGYTKQVNFFNCVVKIKTDLSPMALLLWAKMTELAIGRKPGRRWGPRKLDVDILFYGRENFNPDFAIEPTIRETSRNFFVQAKSGLTLPPASRASVGLENYDEAATLRADFSNEKSGFKNALLAIPHPRLHQRAFVLVGLMELCPGLTHPKLKLSVRQMWWRLGEAQRQSVWRL